MGDYSIIETTGNLDIEIKGLNNDSRHVKKGYIFIAMKGYRTNGHIYIEDAIKNGAICIIHEENCIKKEGIIYMKVKDTVDALAYLSNIYYDQPWSKLEMIGVTGTNGKTTVTHFIKEILENYGMRTGLIGTLGLIMEGKKSPLNNTTPDIRVIVDSLNIMIDKNINTCIMEVSSHSLALDRVKGIKYDIGIFTNLTKDHLDYHEDMESYFQSKLLLFKNTERFNIINMDDPYGKEILNILPNKSYKTYGIIEEADIIARDIIYNINGVNFNVEYKGCKIPIKINIPGKFSVYNALASIACSLALDIPLEIISTSLEKVEAVKGRFEVLPIDKKYSIIIDFAHTPDGLNNVLTVINEFAKGKVIVVFGAGGDRDKSKRSIMGEVVGSLSDYAIVTSDNPRTEKPKNIINDILVGINKTNVEFKAIIDRKKAIKYAIDIARDNDIILLAGKGHEEKMIIGKKTIYFNEREIVHQFIKD